MLPINQVSDSQRRPPRLVIEPTAEVVQPDFGRQARLHAPQDVWALMLQPKHLQEAIMHGFDDLAQGRQPPPQAFWPAMRTLLLRLGDDPCPIGAPPPQAHRAFPQNRYQQHSSHPASAQRWASAAL